MIKISTSQPQLTSWHNQNVRINVSGKCSIDEKTVKQGNGSQILSPGQCSISIKNLVFSGGASFRSFFADVRGGVLKIDPHRTTPFILDGQGFRIDTGMVLMDTCPEGIKSTRYDLSGREYLYLARQTDIHPLNRLVPSEKYLEVGYSPDNAFTGIHGELWSKNSLLLFERFLPYRMMTLKEYHLHSWPKFIITLLEEGGSVFLRKNETKIGGS